ncbi:MAG TPA: DUF4175 family protein [Rhizomicrobium sp.]|nr:DUF4175 family protein [Rhizomicrobium sp.]
MTHLSPETLSRSGSATDPERRLSRAIAWARASLATENFLPALWPALGFAGAYVSLALFGLFAFIPWPAQSLLLAATVTATGLALDAGFAGFSWPSWKDGARRLELDSGLLHRPISEWHDRSIAQDAFSLALWRLHQARRIAFDRLKLRWPAPDLSERDPRYLRYGVIVLLAGGLALAGVHWRDRLMRAFDSGAGLAVTLDGWVDPPPYTGLPPVYLAPSDTSLIAVPAGSTLNLRAHGAQHAPGLQLGISNPPRFTGENGEYTDTAKITGDARVRVRSSGHVIGNWHIHAIADALPVISFDGLPSATEHQAMKISFKASDDYGVTGAKLVMTPHARPGPPLAVDLPIAAAKSITQTNYEDLTPHPYAGLMVDAHLEARDGAGQTGKSNTVTFRLPARIFTDPLARALIEQRQNLATSDAAGKRLVAATLDALTIAPEKFYANATNIYMGLRASYWALRDARAPADITHVEDMLWQIAVSLDEKGLAEAAAELRRLQSAISQALAMHAPQDVVDKLISQYDQAMQRYMQALANNPGAQQQQQPMAGQDSKTLTQKDLEDLLKAIQQMSATGNREQAAQMMAMLQNLLENMKMQKSGQGGQQNKALNDAIQKLGDMMGKERGLLDKTMRQQNGNGDPKDGGSQGLAGQQGQIRKDLQGAMQGLDSKMGQKLGPAGQAMDRAEKSLGQKNLDDAANEEKNAMDAMRQGAEAMAQEAQQNGKGQADSDPLGRSRGTSTTGVKIPGITDMARSREILQELRKRAGERGRPQQELDYYDRLLKEF